MLTALLTMKCIWNTIIKSTKLIVSNIQMNMYEFNLEEKVDKNYIKLMIDRPELFRNSDDSSTIKIIKDIEIIEEYEKVNSVTLGIIYQDSYVIFIKDLVIHPGGKVSPYIRIISASERKGVVILPVLENSIVLLKHFRHSTRSIHYEFPRGYGDDSLSTDKNAAKELFDETGYTIQNLKFLGNVYPDTGILSTQASVYVAFVDANVQPVSDKEEAVCSIEIIDMNSVMNMVSNGEITDGYSLSALALYWAKNILI